MAPPGVRSSSPAIAAGPETDTTPWTGGRSLGAATIAAIPPSDAPPTTTLRAPSPRTARTAAVKSATAFEWSSRPSEDP